VTYGAVLDTIVQITGVPAKYWQEFEEVSPGGIHFSGYVCRQESERLGMLALTKLEGREWLEFIPAMPKIHYPYQQVDSQVRVVVPLPQNAIDARFNVKLDGTCIIWYPLTNGEGKVLEVLPRTRLKPVLTASRWGDWPGLLAEAMPDPSPIERAVREQGVSLAFEMWGYRNPHLVSYDVPLTLTLHTAIRNKRIVSYPILASLAHRYGLDLVESIEVAQLNAQALASAYRLLQARIEAQNQAAGADTFVAEGAVLMISTPRTAVYYKLKPHAIEEIHWAAGRTVSKEIIRQAIFKLTEQGYDFETGRVEHLVEELEKDFEPPQVESQEKLIRRVWVDFIVEQQRKEWLKGLVEESGIDPRGETVELMHHLSAHYPRREMRWVYNTVREIYGSGQR